MTRERTYHELVIVGCGGGVFHALSGMMVLIGQFNPARVRLIDFDMVEERNADRQPWGAPHRPKVELAAELLKTTNPGVEVCVHVARAQDCEENVFNELPNGSLVFCGPDNHECRRWVIDKLIEQADVRGIRLGVVLAGNSMTSGEAYGTWIEGVEGMKLDLRALHPQIWDPAEQEPEGPGCAKDMSQNAETNMNTSICIYCVMKEMMEGVSGVEVGWAAKEGGAVSRFTTISV